MIIFTIFNLSLSFACVVYYLVQFVDDGIFDIKTAKDIRTRDDNRKEARYGEIFYLCTIMYESGEKLHNVL